MHVNVAIAQVGGISLADSRKVTVDRLIGLLERAVASGAELVVFPELTLTTFFPRYWIETEEELDTYYEHDMPNADVEPLFRRARALKVGFYLGYAEKVRHGGHTHRYNTSILVDRDGIIVGKYRKVHLPGHSEHKPEAPFQHLEKRYFEPGDIGFGVWDAFGGQLGMCICNDRRWPETFRVLALQSAQMVLLGFNTPTENIFHDEPLHLRMLHHFISLQAAAYQNGMWVIAVAKSGYEDGHRMHAGSCIVAPTGEIVARTLTEADEVVCFRCDLSYGDYIRRSVFNFAAHRRIDHYRLISERVAPGGPAFMTEEAK